METYTVCNTHRSGSYVYVVAAGQYGGHFALSFLLVVMVVFVGVVAGGKQSCPDLGQMCGNSVELKSFLRLLHTHVALILAYDPCPAVLGRPSNRSHFEATKTVIEQYRTSPKRTKTLLQS